MNKKVKYTIQDIDIKLKRSLMAGEETWCPHCCRELRVQPHKITENMVNFLRRLAARHIAFKGGWYRTADIVSHVQAKHQKRSSDGPAASHWGLIFRSNDSVNAAGAPVNSYQITDEGLKFLRGECAVPAKVYVINKEFWKAGHALITVNQVEGVAFNYPRDVLGLAEELKKLARNREIDD